MHIPDDERYYLKLKASYLYYIEHRMLTEISKTLDLSRPTLNKLLAEARDDGIVTITVNDIRGENRHIELEQRLCKALRLKDVCVVNAVSDDQGAINGSIGAATARYLINLIKPKMTIGIGWGNTLQAMAKYLNINRDVADLEFVSLMGSLNTKEGGSFSTFANSLCETIASNYRNSTVAMLYAPLVASDKASLDAMMHTEGIASVFGKMRRLDIAVVGVDGDIEHSTTLRLDTSLRKARGEFRRRKCVGNVCARFYDREGRTGSASIEERIISISPDDLRNTPTVIGAAGGQYKTLSIISAARTGLFNILITDEYTALALDEHVKK
jgi:deoxyribonucleoside regulator